MERPFRVEEIFLGDVSGQVLGTVTIDLQWGVIETVNGQVFDFRNQRTGAPLELDATGRRAAMKVVEASLEIEPEVVDSNGTITLSGRTASMQIAQDSNGQRALAEFLSSPQTTASGSTAADRSQRRAE